MVANPVGVWQANHDNELDEIALWRYEVAATTHHDRKDASAMTSDEQIAWSERYATEESIRTLTQGLLDTRWPECDWKHREHCVATLGLILFHPELQLDQELPGIIQRYNVAHGGKNTDTSGYHHTMTLLYLHAIRHFLHELPPSTPPADAARALLQSPIGMKDYPLRYYSRERLLSKEARCTWMDPDRADPPYLPQIQSHLNL